MGDDKRAERATGRKERPSGCLDGRRSILLVETAGRMGFVSSLFHAAAVRRQPGNALLLSLMRESRTQEQSSRVWPVELESL